MAADLAQKRDLQAALHHARRLLRAPALERRVHDRRLYRQRRVDDLFDPRHAQRDVHRRHAGEVERLQRHLCGRLADRLRAERAHSRAGLHQRREVRAERALFYIFGYCLLEVF